MEFLVVGDDCDIVAVVAALLLWLLLSLIVVFGIVVIIVVVARCLQTKNAYISLAIKALRVYFAISTSSIT